MKYIVQSEIREKPEGVTRDSKAVPSDFVTRDFSYLINPENNFLFELEHSTGRKYLLVPFEAFVEHWYLDAEALESDWFLDILSNMNRRLGRFPIKEIELPEDNKRQADHLTS